MKMNLYIVQAAFFISFPLSGMQFEDLFRHTVEEGGINRNLPFIVPMHDNRRRQIDKNSFLYRFTTAAFTEYKEYPIKNVGKGLGHSIIPLSEFNSVLDKFIGRYAAPDSQFLNTEKWIDGKAPSAELLKDVAHDLNYRHPYAQKIKLKPQQHIEAFGDMHGSLHSLLRNLWRKVVEGFIDEYLHINKPGDLIFFLGDLVDRGRYSVETLCLALLLKLLNDGCILIRGNHEEPSMGKNGGLYTIRDELRDKYAKTPDLVAQTIKKLNCVWDLLPHAVIVGCNKDYKLVSHAGFDPSYDITHLIADHKARYECLLGKKEDSPLLDASTRERAIEHFNRVEGIPFGEKTGFYCCGLNWLDYARWKNSKNEVIHDSQKIQFSGHGYNVSLKVFDRYMEEVNKKLAPFGKTFGGVVSAHHHTSNGLTLYDPAIRVPDGQACDWKNLVSIHDIMSPQGFSMQLCYPIFTLLSAPEGVGKDNAHGISVDFNKDSSCMITTGKTPEEWRIKPMEYEIPFRSENGVYCMIEGSGGNDPICCTYSEMPSERQVANIQAQQEYRMTNDLDEEVEIIFNRLKKYLHSKMPSTCPDIQLQAHPLTYPIDPSIKTQSLNHIRYMAQEDVIDNDTLPNLLQNVPSFLNLVENILQQEIEHRQDYYVFYHAHEGNLACFHDILRIFHSWGLLSNNQPLPLRFVSGGQFSDNLETFLDNTSSIVKNSSDYYDFVDEDGKPQKTKWFDHIPEMGQQLLAVNYALFGNNSVGGESSLHYFFNDLSQHSMDIKKLLSIIFDQMQIPQFFLDKIMQVTQRYLDGCSGKGKLLQIFVKKEVVNEVAYWAFPGGKPVDQKIFESSWRDAKQRHTEISPLLALYTNDLMQLNTIVSSCHHKGASHNYFLDPDRLQARLWLPSPHLYNPKKTKIIRYGMEATGYAQYMAGLNEIVEEIIRNFIRQRLCDETGLFQHFGTPFRQLDEIISRYKYEKNKCWLSRSSDNSNLEIAAKQVDRFPENCFYQYIRASKDYDMKHFEKKLLSILPFCTRLSCGVSPLIYAVKTNNCPLVEFLMKVTKPRPQVFTRDVLNKTAFDWCKITQNKACLTAICQGIKKEDIAHLKFEELVKLFLETNNKSVLAAIINQMTEYTQGMCEAAQKIVNQTVDETVLKVVIGLVEKWVNAGHLNSCSGWKCISSLVSSIVNKTESRETFIELQQFAEKLIPLDRYKVDLAVEVVKGIVKKTQDNDIVQWALDFAMKLTDYRLCPPQISVLVEHILKKKSDAQTVGIIMNLAEKQWKLKNGSKTISIAVAIMTHNSESASLNWAIDIANQLFDTEYLFIEKLICEICKHDDSEKTLLWALDCAEKLFAHNCCWSVLSVVTSVAKKTSDEKILQRAMKLVIQSGIDHEEQLVALLIIDRTRDSETLQLAFDLAIRLAHSKDKVEGWRLAEAIVDKTNDSEILKKIVKLAEEFVDDCEMSVLFKKIILASSDPELFKMALKIATTIGARGKLECATDIVQMIIKKTDDKEVLKSVMSFVDTFLPDQEKNFARCLLMEIVEKTNDLEILDRVWMVCERVWTKAGLSSIKNILRTICRKFYDSENIAWVLQRIERLIADGYVVRAMEMVEPIAQRNSDMVVLRKIMKMILASIESNPLKENCYRVASCIVYKTNDFETMQLASDVVKEGLKEYGGKKSAWKLAMDIAKKTSGAAIDKQIVSLAKEFVVAHEFEIINDLTEAVNDTINNSEFSEMLLDIALYSLEADCSDKPNMLIEAIFKKTTDYKLVRLAIAAIEKCANKRRYIRLAEIIVQYQMNDETFNCVKKFIDEFRSNNDVVSKLALVVVEHAHGPEVYSWAMSYVEKLIRSGAGILCQDVLNVIIKKSNDKQLQIRAILIEKMLQLNEWSLDHAANFALTIYNEKYGPEILDPVCGVLEHIIVQEKCGKPEDLWRAIFKKVHDVEHIIWAQKHVEKLIAQSDYAHVCNITEAIISNSSNPDSLKWAISIMEQVWAQGALGEAISLAFEIIKQTNDTVMFIRIINFCLKIVDEGDPGQVPRLITTILAKTNNREIVRLVKQFVEQLSDKGDWLNSFRIIEILLRQSHDVKTLRWSMNIVEKFSTRKHVLEVLPLICSIIIKTDNKKITNHVLNLAEMWVSIGKVDCAITIAQELLKKNVNKQQLERANKVIASGKNKQK